MGVAVARLSVLALAGNTPGNQVLGAFPAGLWVPSLRFVFNSDQAGLFDFAPVVSAVDDAGDAAHANGLSIFDRGETTLNGKVGIRVQVLAGTAVELVIPVGFLPGSGAWWVCVRGVHSSVLAVSRIIMSAIAVPFAGAVAVRPGGDGGAPLAGTFRGVGGASTPGGGGGVGAV